MHVWCEHQPASAEETTVHHNTGQRGEVRVQPTQLPASIPVPFDSVRRISLVQFVQIKASTASSLMPLLIAVVCSICVYFSLIGRI